MNQSDIYHRMYEVWKHEQLEPEEKLFVGRKSAREIPTWAMKIPDRIELTESQKEEREDDFLRKHGIK